MNTVKAHFERHAFELVTDYITNCVSEKGLEAVKAEMNESEWNADMADSAEVREGWYHFNTYYSETLGYHNGNLDRTFDECVDLLSVNGLDYVIKEATWPPVDEGPLSMTNFMVNLTAEALGVIFCIQQDYDEVLRKATLAKAKTA